MENERLRSAIERADGLMQQFAGRDAAAAQMRALRNRDWEAIAPGIFSEDYPAPLVANRVDTMARDMMATLTPLPSFNCVPTSNLKENAKKFATKRTQIAKHYVECSNLKAQMPDAADSFSAYGMFAGMVEPDMEYKTPKIRLIDGASVYPVWDKDLHTVECVHVTYMSIYTLQAYLPEVAARLRKEFGFGQDLQKIKVVRYETASDLLVYLPEYGNEVLASRPNPFGKCSYVAVPRPSGKGQWNAVPTGAYDDLIWPMIAANDFRKLALEGVAKTVQAPIAAPMDATEVAFGPDAVIHTNNPQGVRRVDVNIPTQAFTAGEVLDRDLQVGGMSPASRAGSVQASVITGRGVDALGEGYSQQTAMYQVRLAWALQELVGTCFEMDEKFWPNVTKEIRGKTSESPFGIKYTPSKDIAGDYSVEVDYGLLLGLDPNRALVYILQAQGAGLISNATAARYLPLPLNVEEEANRIQLEQLRNVLVQMLASTAQAVPQMVMQGQDPGPFVARIAGAIAGLEKGQPIDEILSQLFAPQTPPAPTQVDQPSLPGIGPGGSEPGAQAPTPSKVPTEGPNGRPDLQMMFAGLTAGGSPNLGATVSRMAPTAGGS